MACCVAFGGDYAMARGTVAFKQRDLARALRAVQKSGMPMARVEIDRGGKIVLIPGEPNQQNDSDSAPHDNEWDEVLR
jgi:hypothetical protein